jgi:hypothetical protein
MASMRGLNVFGELAVAKVAMEATAKSLVGLAGDFLPLHHSTSVHEPSPHHPPIAPAHHLERISTLHNGRVRLRHSCACPRTEPRRTTAAAAHSRIPAQSPLLTAGSWVFRENRVPHYQREFQKHDGLRTWEKVRRAR